MNFGWVRDPELHLTKGGIFHLARAAYALDEPMRVDTIELAELTPIKDQGTELGSCVGCSFTSAAEHLLGGKVTLSALAAYVMALELDGNPGQDIGTRLSTMGRVFQLAGVPEERFYPYDVSTFPHASGYDPKRAGMPVLARERAYDHKGIPSYVIQTWGRPAGDVITDVVSALQMNRKVALGHMVAKDFWTYDGSDPSKVFDAPVTNLGGHCSLLAGVRGMIKSENPMDWEFKIQEPWGVLWGVRGYAWVTARFLTDIGNELTVITDMPGEYA
jgi:hypothetical protein